jgi:hypothetical protein
MKTIFSRSFFYSKTFYVGLFAVCFSLIFTRQKLFDNYGCEVCADKAGYYFYLPATFETGFTATKYAEGFDLKHGLGFHIDKNQNKVITKFTYGVALLQVPFYLLAASSAKIFSVTADPYSEFYITFINLGAAFYIVLGLYFFRRWLEYYFKPSSALLTSLILFTGTGLYYYVLDESLMTHMYSFFLFSSILYSSKKFADEKKFKHFIFFMLGLALAILVRPTNIIFGLIAFFMDVRSFSDFKMKWNLYVRLKNIFAGIFILFLVFLPQFIYWKFAFGKFIVWSYQGEGFTLWNAPRFDLVWFSTSGGLLLYTPLIVVSLGVLAWMAIRRIANVAVIVFSFLLISYLCASWYTPLFGECNFGERPMVEYLPIFGFPIAFLLNQYPTFNKTKKIIFTTLLIFCVYYNQSLFSAFNTCFPGNEWDWKVFVNLLKEGATIIR